MPGALGPKPGSLVLMPGKPDANAQVPPHEQMQNIPDPVPLSLFDPSILRELPGLRNYRGPIGNADEESSDEDEHAYDEDEQVINEDQQVTQDVDYNVTSNTDDSTKKLEMLYRVNRVMYHVDCKQWPSTKSMGVAALRGPYGQTVRFLVVMRIEHG